MKTPDETRECHDCGLLQEVPELEDGSVAHCPRCNAVLRRAARQAESFPLWCAATASALFFIALTIPYLGVRAPGRQAQATVFAGPEWLYERGIWPLAGIVLFTLVLMPMTKLLGLTTVLVAARQKEPPRWLGRLYRYTKKASPWSMVEVFLLGVFVAYTRMAQLAKVSVEPALYLLLGVMLCTVAAEATLDSELIWDLAEEGRSDDEHGDHPHFLCHGCGRLERGPAGAKCWRCGATLHARRPQAIERTWALVLAAMLLYVPANLLPVMTVRRLGSGDPHTILSGVVELYRANLMPLAVLVFVASFVVPIFKLLGILSMLVGTHFRSDYWLKGRTKLYRLIEAVGRWSMLDVFVLAVLVGLVHMGYLGSVLPHWGAAAFGGVVVLTMLASASFDPRLMWDASPQPSEKPS